MMRRRRMTAIVLTLALLLSLLPASALAATQSTESWCNMSTDGKHAWGSWLIRREATCTEKGERYRTCRYCRYEQTESIKKTGHEYGKWRTTREATCSREGERVRKCKVCGHEDRQKLEKLPHTFGSWTVLKPASCTEAGTREHTCQVCGETVQASIAMLPHNWSGWEVVVEATDHSSGTRRRACLVCGAEETEDFEPEGTLHRGDRGDDVRQLQEGLICYGVLSKGGADGDFGSGTERAVRQVQEMEGLEPDGVAWPQTRAFAHHKFGEWKTISKLTRTTDGIRERVCERCGLVERDVAEAWPIIRRGERGKRVELIQDIIWDMGYDPGGIDGIFGPRLDAAIAEWSRDHDWYYDPGLLKPADIDRIVNEWVEPQKEWIGVCGENTPVNLRIEIDPDFNMMCVTPGQSLKYSYTVTNLGTEDCTLGPLFVKFGEEQSYKADVSYLRYIGDLSGEVLKANGANSYTGHFTVSADMDKAELVDAYNNHYAIYVNAWVLGTSKVDSRRWYSNIDWAIINLYSEQTLDENLVLTGRVLDEKPSYTLGDEFEFEATLKNNTDQDLYAYVEGVGRTWEGSSAITGEMEAELLPVGGTLTKSWSYRLSAGDEIRNGRFGFWLEAYGSTEADEPVASPQVSLWVNVNNPFKLGGDDLVLTRESDDPEGTRYPAGETWRYRYRATNNGEQELSDVRIRAFLNDLGYWLPLDEADAGTLAAGAHGDLEGERAVGTLFASKDYVGKDKDGNWIREWGYDVDIVAQGVTPDGETVYAKPLRERIPIDFEDEDAYAQQSLKLTGRIVDPKDEYADGDEIEIEATVQNLSGEPVAESAVRALLGPDYLDDTYDEAGSAQGDGTLEAGKSWTKTFRVPLHHMWDTDNYKLVLDAEGTTVQGYELSSNYVLLSVKVLPLEKNKDKHSLPFPTDLTSKTYSGGQPPVPDGALGQETVPVTWRKLEVVKQTKDDDAYYDNAEIPVLMRLTIDDYDEYDFLGIKPAPGDSVSDEGWMHGTLMPGKSYEFTYTMVLNPEKTGWKTRTVTANLHSHSLDVDEVEACEVRPPWVPAKVTLEDPNVHIINDNMSYLYLKLVSGKFKSNAYPKEIVDIPIAVDSDGNTPIRNVRFNCIEKLNGEAVYAWGGDVRSYMNPGDKFNEWHKIQIKGTEVGQPSGYSLEMYLTGTIFNRKGKPETIRSLPVEVPFTVLNPAGGKKILEFTSRLEPYKSSYAVNDQVDIHFTVKNQYREDLIETRLNCLSNTEPFASLVSKAGPFNGDGKLANDATAEIVLHYTIRPEDIAKEKIEADFRVTATPIGSDTIQSRRVQITIPISAELPQKLTLEASCANSGQVKAGTEHNATLRITNNADQRVLRVRVYAVGDNRFADHDSAVSWHDCGHGAKGWLCGECDSIESGSTIDMFCSFNIPSSYVGKGIFFAQWVVEADLADRSGTVGSNIATIQLGIQPTDDALNLTLTSHSPELEEYALGQYVNVTARVDNPAGTMPDDIEVYYTTDGDPGTPVKGMITNTSGGSAYAVITCQIRETDVVDGTWTGRFVARGFGGEVVSAPQPLQLVVTPVEAAIDKLTLHAEQLTECEDPNGWWQDGDKVKVRVTASYPGKETPKALEIKMTNAKQGEATLWNTGNANTSELVDEHEITLHSSDAVSGQCVYEFKAYGSILDENTPDCESEALSMVFDMAPAEGIADDGGEGPETQINWDAIHAAEAASKAESETGETGEAEATEGTDAKPAEGSEAKATGAEAKSDEDSATEMEAKSDEGGAAESEAKSDDGNTTEASKDGGVKPVDGSDAEATEIEAKSDEGGTTEMEAKSDEGGATGAEAKSDEGGTIEATEGGDAKPADDGKAEVTDGTSVVTEDATDDTGDTTDTTGGTGPTGGGTGGSTGDGVSDTDDGSDEPTYSGTAQTYQAADACMYALAGQGADGATLCKTHSAVADAAEALIEGAEDDPEAWQQAEALWMEALNAEYEALRADADESAVQIIEAESAAFLKWMYTLKAENDDPVYAEWTVCQQLSTQVAALCELRHTAPEPPMGLPELDRAELPTTTSTQKAFANWIEAHKALLRLLYPSDPRLVEMIAAVR